LLHHTPEVLKTSPSAGSECREILRQDEPQPSVGSRVVFVLRGSLAAGHARILQHRICMRDEVPSA